MSDTDKTSDPAAPEAKKNLPYKYIDHAWKDAAFLGYSDLLQVCLPSDAYEKLSFSSEFKFYTDYYLPTLLSGYSIKDALFADVVMEIPLKANPFGPPIIMLVEFQDYLSKKFTKRFMDSMIRLRALHPYSEIGGLAIFTGKVPNENSAFIGTDEFGIIITKFNSYHLMSHSLDELRADPRPFCKVFYAGRLAADESKTVEEKAREIFTEMREARKLIGTNKATLTENQINYIITFAKQRLNINAATVSSKFMEDFEMDLAVPTHAQKLFQDGIERGIEQGKKEGKKEGIEQGKKEGKKEGIEQGKKEDALKMLIKSMSIQDIADITGFTEDEIRAIDEARKKAQQNS